MDPGYNPITWVAPCGDDSVRYRILGSSELKEFEVKVKHDTVLDHVEGTSVEDSIGSLGKGDAKLMRDAAILGITLGMIDGTDTQYKGFGSHLCVMCYDIEREFYEKGPDNMRGFICTALTCTCGFKRIITCVE
jgi:hypothetical protein